MFITFWKRQNWSQKITCNCWNPWPINNNYHPHYWAKGDRESRSAPECTEEKSSPQLPTTHSSWQMSSCPKSYHYHFLLDSFLQLSNPQLQQLSSQWTECRNRRSQPCCSFGFLLCFEGTGPWDKMHLLSYLGTGETSGISSSMQAEDLLSQIRFSVFSTLR